MRALTTNLLILSCLAQTARADSDLVVLGPAAADPSVPATRVAQVKVILDKAAVAPMAAAPLSADCLSEIKCLVDAAIAAGARRQAAAVGVGVVANGTLSLELVLVDVTGKELLARRPLAIREAKLAAQLAPALRKFLDEVPVERAKALFAEGDQHYSLGEFDQALGLYKRAYRAKPLPAFLFNIAQCHRKLDQHQEAIAMYQSYLVGVPNATNRGMVESLIAESRTAFDAQQRLAEAHRAQEAQALAERLAVERKKSEDARKVKEAEARVAEQGVEQARIEAQREREREKLYGHHPARTWAIVAGGIGVGATIGGGVFALAARKAQSRFDSAGCGDPERLLDTAALARCMDDRTVGRRDALFGNVLFGTGAALLVTSALILVIDPGNLERPDQARAKVAITPHSIVVAVRW